MIHYFFGNAIIEYFCVYFALKVCKNEILKIYKNDKFIYDKKVNIIKNN